VESVPLFQQAYFTGQLLIALLRRNERSQNPKKASQMRMTMVTNPTRMGRLALR
jgi:hypothetical protein